jgi:hypothetical protein
MQVGLSKLLNVFWPPHQEKKRTTPGPGGCGREDNRTITHSQAAGSNLRPGTTMEEHVQQAIKRATKVSIALAGLRHLRPEQMRQLYRACVTPVVDYASTVWHDPLRDKTHLRHLNTVQRTTLIRILSAFRTVATATLEVEAHILPTHLRLRHRAQNTIANLHTLPREHPICECTITSSETQGQYRVVRSLSTSGIAKDHGPG